MTELVVMDVNVGVRLASAALQVIAEDAGVDVLHIKGPSVDICFLESLPAEVRGSETARRTPRASVDVDLLVRPSHIQRWFTQLAAHGWGMAYTFEDGSAFEHASTWLRDGLAAADIHRTFPGFGIADEAAFDRLWADRRTIAIAGYPCTVPSLTAQRLILLLHATRGGDLSGGDIHRAWMLATPQERAEVDALAAQLGAEVALAAGTGRLEQHRGAPEYALWRALANGDHKRTTLWSARISAQPTVRAKVGTAIKLARPKPGRLRHRLGREPTLRELSQAWGREVTTVAGEVARMLVTWAGRKR